MAIKCAIDPCPETLSRKAKSKYCPKCQAGLRYWYSKPHWKISRRIKNLEIYQSRVKSVAVKIPKAKQQQPSKAMTTRRTAYVN